LFIILLTHYVAMLIGNNALWLNYSFIRYFLENLRSTYKYTRV